nr:VOC family protein [Nocardioides ochotonae]
MSEIREVQVTVDCADPRALSLFYNAVLGYQLPPPPPGFGSWDDFAASLPPRAAQQRLGQRGPRRSWAAHVLPAGP